LIFWEDVDFGTENRLLDFLDYPGAGIFIGLSRCAVWLRCVIHLAHWYFSLAGFYAS